jgi:G patch domain/KOW motif-containing protein
VVVELKPSGEVVEVTAAELAERGTTRAAAAAGGGGSEQQRLQDSSSRRGRDERDRGREGERDRDRDRGRQPERERDREKDYGSNRSSRDAKGSQERSKEHSRGYERDRGEYSKGERSKQQQQALPRHKLWVASLIRVRIVDKRTGGGKLYLKKGTVMDVRPDGSCDVRLEEEGRGVMTVHQDQLETVVPKDPGAAVMVVSGEHKGRKGRLLQASTSSGAAALQLLGDMQVVRLMLDDVAQFMGHLDDEDE